METTLLTTKNPSPLWRNLVTGTVSFGPYIDFLKQQLLVSNGMKAKFYRFIIRKFEQYPELLHPIDDLEMLANHQELLHLVEATIFPLVFDKEDNLFALTPPLTFEMFYFSKAMYETIVDKKSGFIKELHKGFSNEEHYKNRKVSFLYLLYWKNIMASGMS